MPRKTAGEAIQDILIDLAGLNERVTELKAGVDHADLRAVHERLAVLESQVADLRKRHDEDDRRRWQFWVGVGTVTLTFVANLTVNLLLYFARR